MAAGNNYSTPTTTLLVESAGELNEFFMAEIGLWYPSFALANEISALVVSITLGETVDTIELDTAVSLINDIEEQGAGATITFVQG
jgi:hypothetical protein